MSIKAITFKLTKEMHSSHKYPLAKAGDVIKVYGRYGICTGYSNPDKGIHNLSIRPLSKWWLIRKYQIWKIRSELAGKFPFLCGHYSDGIWWFRIYGYGIAWKDKRKRPELFSERNNLSWNLLRIGNWRFNLLKP